MSRSGKYSWETEQIFVIWMVNLMATMRTEFWRCEFHVDVKGCVGIMSTTYVWKPLWNEMQTDGNNMLRLQIGTQMRKCKMKALHRNTHFTYVVIITTKYDILMSRTRDIITSYNYDSLGKFLQPSYASLLHFWHIQMKGVILSLTVHIIKTFVTFSTVHTLSLSSPGRFYGYF